MTLGGSNAHRVTEDMSHLSEHGCQTLKIKMQDTQLNLNPEKQQKDFQYNYVPSKAWDTLTVKNVFCYLSEIQI